MFFDLERESIEKVEEGFQIKLYYFKINIFL